LLLPISLSPFRRKVGMRSYEDKFSNMNTYSFKFTFWSTTLGGATKAATANPVESLRYE
jgi:hypothetical protein